MKGEKLLLITFICSLMQNCLTLSEESDTINFPPSDLFKWCPHTSFCEQVDPDKVAAAADYGDDVMPCCSSCSCSEDCGRKRNCCKYEYDLYRLDETFDTICEPLRIRSTNKVRDGPFYHIVRACPDRSHVCDSGKLKSYNPVYSHDSGMLYYNPACAECHGQENTTTFKRLITCPDHLGSHFPYALDITNDNVYTECQLNFIIPTDIDLSSEVCHIQNKQQCIFKDFNDSGIYDKLCRSFNATFYDEFMVEYNNVFCFLCSSQGAYLSHMNASIWLSLYEFCPRRDGFKTGEEVTFSLLLDHSDDEHSAYKTEYPGRTLCINAKNEVICRPVTCPEGQAYIDGTCRHLGSAWYFKNVGLSIYLSTPPGATNASEDDILDTSLVAGSKQARLFLERPVFEDWDLTLLYNVNNQTIVRYFIALLFQRSKTIVPDIFLRNVTTSLNGEWRLHANGHTFDLKPRLSKYTGYLSPKNDSTYLPTWYSFPNLIDDAAENTEMDHVRHLLGDRSILDARSRINVVYITKLFFCTLIELKYSDVVYSMVRIYLPSGDKFIEDGEFISTMDEYGDFRVQICLEDYQQSGSRALISTAPIVRALVWKRIWYTLMMSLDAKMCAYRTT